MNPSVWGAFSAFLKRLLPFAALFMLIQGALRLSLTARAALDLDFTNSDLANVLIRGLWFDSVVLAFWLIPASLYLLCLPSRAWGGKMDRAIDTALRFLFTFASLFDLIAEHLFWTEFTTRFNFIAVDYLIYTQEVIGNITESYPLPLLLGAIALSAGLLTWISIKLAPVSKEEGLRLRMRAAGFASVLAACLAFYTLSSADQARFGDNAEAEEIASNGLYNLFYAFWHNEISYERFYATHADHEVEQDARALLWEKESDFLNPDGKDLTRIIRDPNPELHKNVMLVVMESMSASYMDTFGNTKGLTPNLDRLASEGLSFSQAYATGTRTVRGLEAVTLSIPPTPGQSILRRPGNDHLFSLGFIFKDRGYDTRFIYGGYGYFDNMNAFFSGNGFDILDRTSMPKEDIQFANVWGVSDEDLFARAVREADRSHSAQKPFMQLIMTTSNHRPYTYPENRIDIPSHSGREGGVKYADYSIGKFIEESKTKPWFNNTVFVFIADHTAGAAGKKELDPRKYHIPMIVYAPSFIKPRTFEPIASQIDLAPILLGLLHFSYYSKFYGENLLEDEDEIPHAFISNYQKVALIKQNGLTVLEPKRKVEQYSWPQQERTASSSEQISDAIAYYQSASWWRQYYQRIPTVMPAMAEH